MRDVIGFFILVVGTLCSLFVVWFGLKSYGQSRDLSTFQTPLVSELTSQNQALQWRSTNTQGHRFLELMFDGQKWGLVNQPAADLKSQLKKQASMFNSLLLFVDGRDPKALPDLRKLITEMNLAEKTIFCSRQDGLLKDLRDLEPRWTFCNGEAYMIRMLAFSSLGLESLLEIPADVVFIHMTTTLASNDIRKIIAEGRRQNKLVIVGPVSRPLEGLNPHGWMVEIKDPKVQ